jgi:hypothetical protein
LLVLGGKLWREKDGLTREGVAANEFRRDAELAAEFADFVFKELAEGFDELEAVAAHEALCDAADVVVCFDGLRGALEGDTLDHI